MSDFAEIVSFSGSGFLVASGLGPNLIFSFKFESFGTLTWSTLSLDSRLDFLLDFSDLEDFFSFSVRSFLEANIAPNFRVGNLSLGIGGGGGGDGSASSSGSEASSSSSSSKSYDDARPKKQIVNSQNKL